MGHHVITIGHWDYTHMKYPLGSHVSLPRMLEELRAVGVEVDLVIEQEANFFFAGLAERPSWLPTVPTVCNAWDFNRIDRCRLFDFNFISQKGFVARTLTNLGNVLQEQGDLPDARECLERARRIFEAEGGHEDAEESAI